MLFYLITKITKNFLQAGFFGDNPSAAGEEEKRTFCSGFLHPISGSKRS